MLRRLLRDVPVNVAHECRGTPSSATQAYELIQKRVESCRSTVELKLSGSERRDLAHRMIESSGVLETGKDTTACQFTWVLREYKSVWCWNCLDMVSVGQANNPSLQGFFILSSLGGYNMGCYEFALFHFGSH